MKTHNLAFIDTETTGLNPDYHEVIEFACIIGWLILNSLYFLHK
jgi:oligoribonuclease (3'-5' exoribonuclease)